MDLDELFERIRRLNTRALGDAMRAHAPCHVEPALRDDDGDLAIEGAFDLPCRVDLFPTDADGNLLDNVMVAPRTALQFADIDLSVDGMPVRVMPFGWDNAHLRAAFAEPPDLDPLLRWFMHWFDAEDEREEDDDGLFGVAHYLSDPVYADGELRFVVDFGSAAAEAAIALLQVLHAMRASHVEIGPEPALAAGTC